jgi:hypothetical protein
MAQRANTVRNASGSGCPGAGENGAAEKGANVQHLGRENAPGASQDELRPAASYGRGDSKKFRDRFVRQTIERVNTLRDVACGVFRLRMSEAEPGMEELRRIILPDLPPRKA